MAARHEPQVEREAYGDEREYEVPSALEDEAPMLVPDSATLEGGFTTAHLASLDEKKRLWWRSAIVNSIFILCW
jgi:solute carrier family 35, member C2